VRLNRGAKFRDLLALVFLLAALATGCAAVQNPTLEGIREDPLIVRNAGAALDRAGQLLQVADEIWAEERDVAEVEHLAYLVQKRIEIARTIAKRRVAASDIQPQLSR
jgi:ABC-type branched-subunit amino acid transport system ATPase component